MFIILQSSNECKAYLTLTPFTVVSAYIIVNKSFYCVIGFDIIQALSSRTTAVMGLIQINTCRKVPEQVNFALPSMSLIFLRTELRLQFDVLNLTIRNK